jgi:hypothetical protein
MTNYLRQATTASIILGPFVDDTNGFSAETGLTITAASLYVSKRGSSPVAINSSSAATHKTLGYYGAVLDATDTASAGDLVIMTAPSGALPVWRQFNVLSPSAYDAIVLGASSLPVNVEMWKGTILATPDTAGIPKVSITASGITASAIGASAINNSNFAATAGSVVWNVAVRGLTDKVNFVLGASSISGSTIAASTIDSGTFSLTAASQVWNAAVRGITTMGACAIGTTAIAGSAISAPTLAASTVLATHLKTGTITGDSLAASLISSTKLTSGTIVTDTFAASAITNAVFAANAGSVMWNNAVRTVTGGSVVAVSGSVVITSNLDKTGYVLAASSIAGSTIAASTIDSGTFSLTAASQVWNAAVRGITIVGACAIGTTAIAGSAISAPTLAASTMLDTHFKTGALTGDSIAASAFTNSKFAACAIGIDTLAGSAVSAPDIAASTFLATHFKTGAIVTDTFAASAINNSVFAETAGSVVWNSAVRTITGGSVVATSGSVVVTTVLDKTGYSLAASGLGVTALTDATLGAINVEVDAALNTAIPGSPTADSINERIKAIDDLTQTSGGGDLAAIKGYVVEPRLVRQTRLLWPSIWIILLGQLRVFRYYLPARIWMVRSRPH